MYFVFTNLKSIEFPSLHFSLPLFARACRHCSKWGLLFWLRSGFFFSICTKRILSFQRQNSNEIAAIGWKITQLSALRISMQRETERQRGRERWSTSNASHLVFSFFVSVRSYRCSVFFFFVPFFQFSYRKVSFFSSESSVSVTGSIESIEQLVGHEKWKTFTCSHQWRTDWFRFVEVWLHE